MKLFNKIKKNLGQNFLIDQNIIKKIIKIGDLNKNKIVLEIGPGTGNLTKKIVEMKPKKILAIEKDKNLTQYLKKKFSNNENLKIINEDILHLIKGGFSEKNVTVYGNLPYNISTQILVEFILLSKWPPWFDILIFMFQKEVAERIIEKSKSKKFGRLSVISNWRMEIKKHFDVSKNCFYPKPKINSTVLSFKPIIDYKFKLKNPKNLENITRVMFSTRRKMINKNFFKLFGHKQSIADELNIKLNQRPEQLSNETYYRIASKYEKLFN
jgi:16S rRNA (adenine1518-N6/adenine1519-N6)-dimethyltransferase